jgi:N-acetylneuraminic acid mutarotase
MKKVATFSSALFVAGLLFAAAAPKLDPLPVPLSGNVVVSLKAHGSLLYYSLMGIGPKKTWDAVTNAAYALDPETGKWSQVRPVPGTAGRLGASAVAAREQLFLLGGLVLDSQGGVSVVPDLNVYEPLTDRWYRGSDLPVRVAESVAGVYRDRYVYVIGGWSSGKGVTDVQVYDAEKDNWLGASSMPSQGVFGHAGAIVDDTIVYVDGAYRKLGEPGYLTSDECWMGKIDHKDPTKIQWTKLPGHPGAARFGIAAAGSEKDRKIYFLGGSGTVYGFNGLARDGTPVKPSPLTFAFNLRDGKWEVINAETPNPAMDQRGFIVTSQGLVTIGGMEAGQKVSAAVRILPKQSRSQ